MNLEINDKAKTTMENIGKAVRKGAIDDVRHYLSTSDNITNNAVAFLRGDYINTNLFNMVATETVKVKLFKRCSWTGALVIDTENNLTFSICARKTLERIPKNKNRQNPHYLQTLLNTVNKDEKAPVKQMDLSDFGLSYVNQFTDEDYEKDFFSIMEEAISCYSGYRHLVIAYELDKSDISSMTAILLDGGFDAVQEISIMDMLEPNFGDLTVVETKSENQKDAHSLVSVKAGFIGRKSSEPERHTEILPKAGEEIKKA